MIVISITTSAITYFVEENTIEVYCDASDCQYEENGVMIPLVIDSGNHAFQTFIIVSIIGSLPLLIILCRIKINSSRHIVSD